MSNKAQNFETTVSVKLEDYDRLMKDSLMLTALYAVGVENWERFKYAQTLADGGEINSED